MREKMIKICDHPLKHNEKYKKINKFSIVLNHILSLNLANTMIKTSKNFGERKRFLKK